MPGKIIFFMGLLLSYWLTGCAFFGDDSGEDAVARVGDHVLYQQDIKGIIPAGGNEKDSIEAIENYIKNWIKQQTVLQKAEENLPEYQLDVQKKLENYRRSLIIYRYETALIQQELDTIISEDEIKTYYENHKNEFTLRDNIVKVRYVKVPADAPNQRQLKSFLQSEDPEDHQKLMEFCDRYAVNYFLDDESWLLFNDLLREIPIKTYNQENYLKNNRYVVEEDSLFKYHVIFKGFRIKESHSPLSFERDRIRDMIINQRKMKLIREMEEAVLKEAYEKNKIETFNEF
ncbi:MAG: hypothetical protein R6U19_01040 [Bacteroidales bacterium]